MTKYKGIDKEKILKIQEVHMPKFAVPDIDSADFADESVNSILTDAIKSVQVKENRDSEIFILCEMALRYLEICKGEKLQAEIRNKLDVIAENLHKGKHVELCENKDGLRIIAMDRKVVK